MSLTMRWDNYIVDVVTPEMAREQEVRREGHKPVEGAVIPAVGGRFNLGGSFGKSEDVQHIESLIRINPVQKWLPIPCNVDWSSTQISVGPNKTYQRVGILQTMYSRDLLGHIFKEGAFVQFKTQLPGQEDWWFEIVSIKTDSPLLAMQQGTITCNLRSSQAPKKGLNDDGD